MFLRSQGGHCEDNKSRSTDRDKPGPYNFFSPWEVSGLNTREFSSGRKYKIYPFLVKPEMGKFTQKWYGNKWVKLKVVDAVWDSPTPISRVVAVHPGQLAIGLVGLSFKTIDGRGELKCLILQARILS